MQVGAGVHEAAFEQCSGISWKLGGETSGEQQYDEYQRVGILVARSLPTCGSCGFMMI